MVNAAILGWLRKNGVPALDRNGYRSTKVSSKAKKAGAKKIAEALNRTAGCDNGKSAHAYVGCVTQHEGVTGKGRDKYQVVCHT